MCNYESMSLEELDRELNRYKDFLEEVIDEREMIFSTTGIHRVLTAKVEKYEKEISEIKEKIEDISCLIDKRNRKTE